MRTVEARFREKVKVDFRSGCHIWLASRLKYRGGYGQFWAYGKMHRAHKFAYEQVHGPIPEGTELNHKCRNTACVNPAHMEVLTRAQHVEIDSDLRRENGKRNGRKAALARWSREK